jgi:hypothetical protein
MEENMENIRYLLFICFLIFATQVFSLEESPENIINKTEGTAFVEDFSQESQPEQAVNETTALILKNELPEKYENKLDLSDYLFVNKRLKGEPYIDRKGLPVSYKRAREIVSVVAENKALLRQERGLRITSNVLLGTFAFFGLVWPSATFAVANNVSSEGINLSNEERRALSNIYASSMIITTFSFSGAIIFGRASKLRFQRSVDNYNYYISHPQK